MKRLLPLLIGLALLCKTDAFGVTLYFWDTDGPAEGPGGATPTGTWGTDPYWSPDDNAGNLGTQATETWPAGKVAVFAAGPNTRGAYGAYGSYTVHVSGTVQVADIHVDRGIVTFEPDPVNGGSLKLVNNESATTPRQLSVGAFDDNAVARYNVPLTDSTGVVRYKIGTVILGATNTFTGSLTIESGLTLCAVPYALGGIPSLVLANLDMGRPDVSPFWESWAAVFQTGGLDQQLGTLKFAGNNFAVERSLDLGNGSGTLSFADSSAEDWTSYTLTVKNYALGSSKLRFGTTASGLASAQLAQIRFADFANVPGKIDAQGFVTPMLPAITAITKSGNTYTVTWNGLSGRTYRVQSRDSLLLGDWADLSGDISGDIATYDDTAPASTTRYYRVALLP